MDRAQALVKHDEQEPRVSSEAKPDGKFINVSQPQQSSVDNTFDISKASNQDVSKHNLDNSTATQGGVPLVYNPTINQ